MTDANSQWIETNLQRQRKILEDKQKKKRHQSAGSMRTALASSSTMHSMNDFPVYDNTPLLLPAHSSGNLHYHHHQHQQLASPTSSPPHSHVPKAPPRGTGSKSMMQSVVSLSTTHNGDSIDNLNEVFSSVHDFREQSDLTAKMKKVNLETCVVSDDESDANSNTSSPWNNSHVRPESIPCDGPPDFNYIKNNLSKFVEDVVATNTLYKCVITRQKSGLDKGMFPTYFLHLEDTERHQRIFLLAARKRKKSATANYLITTDPTRLSKDAEGYCAKVRSNALGTQFTVYDNGQNPKNCTNPLAVRSELAAVIYDTNVLGFKGPRKMTIILPGIEPETDKKPVERVVIRPVHEKHTLLERYKSNEGVDDQIKVLQNKNPQWNDESQSYVLNFHGRVTQASVKNFQIIHTSAPEYITMQFGRISDEEFNMDFKYPMSPIQAFGIAMTSFHGKLACE